MKKWYKSEERARIDAEQENCEIVTGSNGSTDIYYLIPRTAPAGIVRTILRSFSDCNGRNFVSRVIYKHADGTLEVIERASQYRIDVVRSGRVPEDKACEYLKGYYTLREETSDKIRRLKENARISHMVCDAAGKEGHEMRQQIRRELTKKAGR